MTSASLSDRFRRAVQCDDIASAKRIYNRALAQGVAHNGAFDVRNEAVMPDHNSHSATFRAHNQRHHHHHQRQQPQQQHKQHKQQDEPASAMPISRPFHSHEALGLCPALSATQYNVARQSRIRERNREAGRAKSSLALAVENGSSVELIQWLLDVGHERGDFSRDTRGCTAVSLAAQHNRIDVIEACCIDAVAHAATLHHQRSLMYGYRSNVMKAYKNGEDDDDDDGDEEEEEGSQASHDMSNGELSPALTLVTAAASTPSRRPSPSPLLPSSVVQGIKAAVSRLGTGPSPESSFGIESEGGRGIVTPDIASSVGGSSELDDIVGVTTQRLLDCPDELGRTALALASMKGHVDSVRLLLDLGATIDLGDYEGNSPLHYASAFDQLIVVQVLIEHGCSFAAKNSLGFTAADYAFNTSLKSNLEALARKHFDDKRSRGRITAATAAATSSPSPTAHAIRPSIAPHSVPSNGALDAEAAQKLAAMSSASSTVGLFPAALRSPDGSLPSSPLLTASSQLRDAF